MENTNKTAEELHEQLAKVKAELASSHAETRAAFETRAHMYAQIYLAFAEELGAEKTAELMKRGIYRRGLEVGRKYRGAAEAGDLEAVGRIFCEGSPCGGTLFEPGVEEISEGRIVLRMTACPLVEAWRKEDLTAEQIDQLCEIAAAVDEGTFEGAGLDLEFADRLGKEGSRRCLLDLRVREKAGE
ncbi:MAG: L-2-amino-thiazoline-4-carboxylic acid hydrolase [Coriobacteriia bacterium]